MEDKADRMKCNLFILFSICCKFLKKFIEIIKNDVLEKYENKNHCWTYDSRSYWVCNFNYC